MKGIVRINNYVDNRVVLSGRKIKKDIQNAVQSHRPRPIIVHHINCAEENQQYIDQKILNDELEHNQGKKKKRNRTAFMNSNDGKTKKKRVSVSLEQLRKGITSSKKKSSSSSPSKDDSEQIFLNETLKKMKPSSKQKSTSTGLGQRCKSAIIKGIKSPEKAPITPKKLNFKKDKSHVAEQKIKNEKKQKKQPSNSIFSSKKDKQKGTTQKNKKDQKKTQKSSHNTPLKKGDSSLNLQLVKKKQSKNISGKGNKTNRNYSKSQHVSSKQSKPVSARDYRKINIKTNKMFEGIQDQTQILENKKIDHINLSNLLAQHQSNETVQKMISELEVALNSIGSRKKIAKDLQIITNSVKALAVQNQLEEEEQNTNIQNNKQFILNQELNNQSQQKEEKEQNEQQIKIQGKQQQNQKDEKSEEEDSEEQVIYDEKTQKINNFEDFLNLNEQIQRNQRKDALHRQLFADAEQEQEDDENFKKNNLQNQKGQQLGFYHDQDNDYEKVQIQHDHESNPLLNRRGLGEEIDLNEYDSVNSNLDERQSQIEQLKKFQKQSDSLMKKVKKKLEIDIESEEVKKKQSPTTPINTEQYAFEKFPQAPTDLQSLKSPKYSQTQIIQAINLKGLTLSDKHKKMGQLVNTLYKKDIMSPKTYNIHINSLQKQYEQDNQILDVHRKHAQQLAKLISDIKKERSEIHGIDELIRSEKWEEALGVLKKSQIYEKQSSIPINQEYSSEHIQYEGESQISQPAFRLIPVEDNCESKQQGESTQIVQIQQQIKSDFERGIITIEEQHNNSQVKSTHKGFDSNLFFIKQYCISLCQYVRDHYKQQFKKNLSHPIKYDLDELLESFRTLNNGDPAQKINSLFFNLKYHQCLRKSNYLPISEQIFDRFNESYENIKFYGKQQTQDAALQGIFLRSIFNALNQSIGMERPGALYGQPLPWAHTSKHLKNLKNAQNDVLKAKNPEEEDMIFGIAVARIIQWGSCLCGFIPDTVDLQNTEIDQQYINHIRQTRMALLLQKMLADEEAEMHKTELQETQVCLYMSQIVYNEILKEVTDEFNQIQEKRDI